MFIPGIPRPHQRPELRDGRYRQRADRPLDMCWRTAVRAAWLRAVGNLGWTEPVTLAVVFVGGRGDLSNLIKGIEDALGARGWSDGFAPLYWDDRQVKWYVPAGWLPAPTRDDSGVFVGAWLC